MSNNLLICIVDVYYNTISYTSIIHKLINKYGSDYLQEQFSLKNWSDHKIKYIQKIDINCRHCGSELLPKCLRDEKIAWPGWCNKKCKKNYQRHKALSRPRKCRRCETIFYAMAGRCCEKCSNELSYTKCNVCGIQFRYRKSKNVKKYSLKNVPLYCLECSENLSNNKDTIPELCIEGILQQHKIDYIKQWRDHKIWDQSLRRYRLFSADFYLPTYNCIFEADGDYWHGNEERRTYDKSRDELFKSIGIMTYRFAEKQIKSDPFLVEKKICDILKI